MSKILSQMSSGFEPDARGVFMDEKKRRRMISNRESARRSRLKKQKLLGDLINEVAALKIEIQKNTEEYEVLMQNTLLLESENNFLKAQQIELAQYLRNLELMRTQMEVLQMNLKQPGNFSDQNKEPQVEPWQCYGSAQQPAIMASAGMFNY